MSKGGLFLTPQPGPNWRHRDRGVSMFYSNYEPIDPKHGDLWYSQKTGKQCVCSVLPHLNPVSMMPTGVNIVKWTELRDRL